MNLSSTRKRRSDWIRPVHWRVSSSSALASFARKALAPRIESESATSDERADVRTIPRFYSPRARFEKRSSDISSFTFHFVRTILVDAPPLVLSTILSSEGTQTLPSQV